MEKVRDLHEYKEVIRVFSKSIGNQIPYHKFDNQRINFK